MLGLGKNAAKLLQKLIEWLTGQISARMRRHWQGDVRFAVFGVGEAVEATASARCAGAPCGVGCAAAAACARIDPAPGICERFYRDYIIVKVHIIYTQNIKIIVQ